MDLAFSVPRKIFFSSAVDSPVFLLCLVYIFQEKLLNNGDKWEAEIAANIEADYLYR